jgi:peptidoglycan/xylan/chitin deacetylase (PgdA/CDA1 family)
MKLLDWEQIREMDAYGIEFGAHTVNHPFLDALPLDQTLWEISESKKIIEDHLSHKIDLFAYPYGRYNPQVRELVSTVYSGACGTYNGYVDSKSDRYAIQRIDVNYYRSQVLFRQLFNGVSPPYLKLRQFARMAIGSLRNRDWY